MPLFAFSHSGSPVTGPTSPGHIDEGYIKTAKVPPQCRYILQSTRCARPVRMQQPYRPGMPLPAGQANLTVSFLCIIFTFCFLYCGLRFYAQSHSDNGNFSMFCTCTRSGLPHNVLHSTSSTTSEKWFRIPLCRHSRFWGSTLC